MRALISIVLLALVGFGCAEAHQKASAPVARKLYFAVELHRQGKLVGHPKLLGETGKLLKAERRQPGSDVADYVLLLNPTMNGAPGVYHLDLDVATPEAVGHSEISLLHGEVRKLELGHKPGDLAVTLTLMEVDSPEFRTLMALINERTAGPGAM